MQSTNNAPITSIENKLASSNKRTKDDDGETSIQHWKKTNP